MLSVVQSGSSTALVQALLKCVEKPPGTHGPRFGAGLEEWAGYSYFKGDDEVTAVLDEMCLSV